MEACEDALEMSHGRQSPGQGRGQSPGPGRPAPGPPSAATGLVELRKVLIFLFEALKNEVCYYEI